MSAHDREVLDLLRDEPELLAIADAVADTQRSHRPFRPLRAIAAVSLTAAAIFALVLAAPWDRGSGSGTVLERALAAIEVRGPVVHLTTREEALHGRRAFPALVTESYYDRQRHLVHVVTRSEGAVVADYTTSADEIHDELATFPGLLDQADFYRKALESGRARVVGKGEWKDRSVYWVELDRGGAFILRIGIDRTSYRPVVFRTLDPDGTFSGYQLAVLGFGYVSTREAGFDTDAPVLVTGRVIGPDCRPVKARVAASIAPAEDTRRVTLDSAVEDTGPDGMFTLRADPMKSPFREALGKDQRLNFHIYALSGAGAPVNLVGFSAFSRFVQGGRWLDGEPAKAERPAPVTIDLVKRSAPKRHC